MATVDWVTWQTLAHPPASACFSSVGGGSGCRVTPGYHPTPYTDPWGPHSSLHWSVEYLPVAWQHQPLSLAGLCSPFESVCRWTHLSISGIPAGTVSGGPGSDPALASACCPIDVPGVCSHPDLLYATLTPPPHGSPRRNTGPQETSSAQTGPSVGL